MLPLKGGNYYHIYNRGNNKENIFLEEKNYQYFLSLYQKYIMSYVDTFAYCLLPNHFHLLLRVKTSPVSNLSRQFSHFFNAYAKAFNKAYNRTGSLFQKNFQRRLITSEPYLYQVLGYIHVNPQRHGFIEDFRKYPYSSYQILLSKNDTFLTRYKVIHWFGGAKQYKEFHKNIFDGEPFGI
jgi:REP element-mobilizing transposase RayT